MMEVDVILDFACCVCERPVSVLVKCTGKGLAAGPRVVAAVSIACPNCDMINQLSFHPDGTVRSVAPYEGPRPLPQPSLN